MIRLVTRGCFTESYAKGLVSAPEDAALLSVALKDPPLPKHR